MYWVELRQETVPSNTDLIRVQISSNIMSIFPQRAQQGRPFPPHFTYLRYGLPCTLLLILSGRGDRRGSLRVPQILPGGGRGHTGQWGGGVLRRRVQQVHTTLRRIFSTLRLIFSTRCRIFSTLRRIFSTTPPNIQYTPPNIQYTPPNIQYTPPTI